jgi:hypothetical protein
MSQLEDIRDKIGNFWAAQIDTLKKKIFGVNNERLDFFMDSFSKLASKEKALVAGGAIALVVGILAAMLIVYFVQVGALQKELSDRFSALHKLQSLRAEEALESKRFDLIVESIKRKTSGLHMKPFFEKISKDTQVMMSNLKEETLDLEAKNPLAKSAKLSRVTMKFPKISIPKVLQFLIEVEKADKYLRVGDLKITGMYGNKLYFDVTVSFLGYSI